METIALIPARGGSKRVPDKNLALFNGKPLVEHTVEQAIQADIFDNIIVSTDDQRIESIVSNHPVKIFNRSSELASDNAILLDVIRDVIQQLSLDNNSMLGLLLVTAPLRNVEDIRKAYRLFEESNKQNALVSVCKDTNPLHLSWRINENILEPVFPDFYKVNVSKKNREVTYFFNDALIFDTTKNFMKHNRNLFGDTPIPYVMPLERSVYIDYEFQLKMIQAITTKE